MARPKKQGLDYFPFDVSFFDNFKIIDLLNEYGPLGITIYQIIISLVYKNGYYLEGSLDKIATLVIRIIGNRWAKNKNFVLQVIQYCADIELFDNALLQQSVITSVGIQQRYAEVTVRNKVDKSKYWLLEKENFQEALKTAPQKIVSVTETPVNVTETKVNDAEMQQSKLNEIKEKENCSATNSTDLSATVVNTYNTICKDLNPFNKKITKKHKDLILNLSNFLSNNEITFDYYFKKVQNSDFLKGYKYNWKANFEWLIKKENAEKVLIGNYDNDYQNDYKNNCYNNKNGPMENNINTDIDKSYNIKDLEMYNYINRF